MKVTTEKIKDGTIRIENGRLVGLGIGSRETIAVDALDKLMGAISRNELADSLNVISQQLGALGLYLYHAGESIPDPTGALESSVPDENALYHICLVSKLFRA